MGSERAHIRDNVLFLTLVVLFLLKGQWAEQKALASPRVLLEMQKQAHLRLPQLESAF